MKLDKKLLNWQENGLITAEQQKNILNYEAKHHSNNHWVVYGFMMLGAVVSGIGIISIIAANWADIPASIKLLIDFILLILLGLTVFRLQKSTTQTVWFELALVSFQLLCLASIGLISQIYHTGGMWYHALLLWAIITLPITLYSKKYFSSFLWVSLFLSGFIWTLIEYRYESMGLAHRWWNIETRFAGALLLAPLLSISLALVADYFKQIRFADSFRFWFVINAIACLIFADIFYWTHNWSGFISGLFLPVYIIASILAVLIILRPSYTHLSKLFLLLALSLLLLLYHPSLLAISKWNEGLFQDLFAPFLILSILLLYALHLGMTGQKQLFNLVTFLIGLRFLIVYFEAMGGLAATGLGFIISGLVIIAVSYGWYQYRGQLHAWARKLT